MTARLEFGVDGNDGMLHLQFIQPHLEAGLGVCRLGLEYQLQASAFTNGVGIMLSGECRCRNEAAAQWLGTLLANVHPFVMHRGGVASPVVELSLSLSFDQLWALEQARAGQDLQLLIRLHAAQTGKLFEEERSGPYSFGQHEITIPASRWADLLTELGALVHLPILVPLPLGDPESRFGAAGRHVQQAWRAVTDGRWEDAIRTARLALDIIKELEGGAYPTGIRSQRRSLPQRFLAMREDLRSLAHGASHDDSVTKDFHYTRADAVAIVAATAGLLARMRLP